MKILGFKLAFALGLGLPVASFSDQKKDSDESACSRYFSMLPRLESFLSLAQLDEVLHHYALHRVQRKHGVWVIDVNLEKSLQPLAGHAIEVLLEIQQHPPLLDKFEIHALKFSRGVVFAIVARESKKILDVILGRGFDEESHEAAQFAVRLKGSTLKDEMVVRLDE